MHARKILVFFGGCSTEYAVSLQSAAAVLENLDPARWAPVPVGITREGDWYHYTGPIAAIPADTWHKDAAHCARCTLNAARGARELWLADGRRVPFDAAFPVLHGKNGEDGTLQGLLELAGVPVIGCGCLSGALCMDKDRAHKLAALAGVAVPQSAVFLRGTELQDIQAAAETIGWPVFVKPVRAGSSFGISRVDTPDALAPAVEEAFRHDDEIVLEETIPGFEVGCGVMGNPGGPLTVGAVDEIELAPVFSLIIPKSIPCSIPPSIAPPVSRKKPPTASAPPPKPSTRRWTAGVLPGWTCSLPRTGGSFSMR